MTTQIVTVGQVWTQLTDGTQDKTVQVLSGVILMVDSDSAPAPEAQGHIVSGWMTITAPTKAWVRVTAGYEAEVAIS